MLEPREDARSTKAVWATMRTLSTERTSTVALGSPLGMWFG